MDPRVKPEDDGSGCFSLVAELRLHQHAQIVTRPAMGQTPARRIFPKKQKKSPQHFSPPPKPPVHSPSSRRGYTARRCGEAGSVLGVGEVTRPLHSQGRAAIPPAATGGGHGVGFGPAGAVLPMPDLAGSTSGSANNGCRDSIHPSGFRRRAYRQLIVSWSNAIVKIEAKVRRYTGRRCICPVHPEKVNRTDRKATIWPALETCWRVGALRKTDRDCRLYEMFGALTPEGRCG